MSTQTLTVQYDRLTPAGQVAGTVTQTLTWDDFKLRSKYFRAVLDKEFAANFELLGPDGADFTFLPAVLRLLDSSFTPPAL